MDLINDLTTAGIITDNEASRLHVFLETTFSDPPPLFKVLYHFFVNRDSEDPLGNHNTLVVISDLSPLSFKQQNKLEISVLLEILKKHNIIPDAIYHKLVTLAENYSINELAILHLANELLKLNATFTIEKQLEFAKMLDQKHSYSFGLFTGIVNNEEQELLQEAIKENKLQTYLDFFKYSHFCTNLDLSQYQDDHKKLFTELTEILNNLTYHTFNIQEISDSTSDFSGSPIHHSIKYTIYINTREQIHQYDHTDFSMPEKKEGKILENVLKSVNTLLADFNCSYRFTSITSKLSDVLFPEYRNKLIICRVDRENHHIFDFHNLDSKLLYINPTPNFQLPISYKLLAYIIHYFKESGIFSNLNEIELSERIAGIYQKSYYSPSDILALFPEIAIPVVTDPAPGKNPYKQFLESLNRISNGVLNFSNIKDGFPNYNPETYFNGREFKVSFEINGEQYKFVSNYLEIGFNNPVMYGIKEIISQKYPDYQLIRLSTSRIYHDLYLFTSKETISYLESVRIL